MNATHDVKSGDAIVVPAGARHNLINTNDKPLRLYTLYGPPSVLDHRGANLRAAPFSIRGVSAR